MADWGRYNCDENVRWSEPPLLDREPFDAFRGFLNEVGRVDENVDEKDACREKVSFEIGCPEALPGLEEGGIGAGLFMGSPPFSARVLRFC